MPTVLAKIADREQELHTAADQLRARIEDLAGQLRELDAELDELAIARKVILALSPDEATPRLPDNPVYQHALTVLGEAAEPLRARDLCRALNMGTEPTQIEGMRDKLKRLVTVGLAIEPEPGLFTMPRARNAR